MDEPGSFASRKYEVGDGLPALYKHAIDVSYNADQKKMYSARE